MQDSEGESAGEVFTPERERISVEALAGGTLADAAIPVPVDSDDDVETVGKCGKLVTAGEGRHPLDRVRRAGVAAHLEAERSEAPGNDIANGTDS